MKKDDEDRLCSEVIGTSKRVRERTVKKHHILTGKFNSLRKGRQRHSVWSSSSWTEKLFVQHVKRWLQ